MLSSSLDNACLENLFAPPEEDEGASNSLDSSLESTNDRLLDEYTKSFAGTISREERQPALHPRLVTYRRLQKALQQRREAISINRLKTIPCVLFKSISENLKCCTDP
mmetsp:Transcript_16686/g.19220  ORF Transcript_16686/g.19220 Transcript_16686/m.19220 type:complete len:108 (-) Transcript_16686:58-381(-)